MKQFSLRTSDYWDLSFWLIFDNSGGVRLTRGEPSVGRSERAMSMSVKLPLALFQTPSLRATMTIEAPMPVVPPIDLTAAAEALKQTLGFDIDIKINELEASEQ